MAQIVYDLNLGSESLVSYAVFADELDLPGSTQQSMAVRWVGLHDEGDEEVISVDIEGAHLASASDAPDPSEPMTAQEAEILLHMFKRFVFADQRAAVDVTLTATALRVHGHADEGGGR